MMYNERDWAKAITKLVELTSREELSWEIFDDYEQDPMTSVDKAYFTIFNNKYYVIKSSRYRHYIDEDQWLWSELFEFEVYERTNTLDFVKIATAPALGISSTLFSVAESSLAFKRNVLGGLLE